MCFAINIVSRWYLWTKAVLKFSPKFHVPCMFSFFGNCYSCIYLHEVLILIIYSSSVIPTSITITEKWSFASTLWPVLGMWSFWFKLHMDLHVKAAGDGECCSEAAFSDSEITFFFLLWVKTKPCEFFFHYKLYKLLCRNASFQIGEAYGVLFVFPFLLEFISWSDGRFQPASQRSSCQKKPLAITSASMKCFNFGKTQRFSKKNP